ncbi:hypothetical protein EMIHUDRAFT_226886 [Emiliania huxleyi CCMP1516]|uniref:TLC domain-containing protein n=2 Tax=Emiliania huxleyi TaxID=2903 RepID=A0A0D3KJV3_EMIH1|nr:hypothetical protein EMIHUDRAFT_226886 [Emiliania huxleyi CCMP1516]EOD36038.1 hypothetical protein EMIHUDRAFT_226886 [Emiliania huxleyi CCMP1516]|eukprot:XP_005788467.1 hypothetical protein EMIHUDRAFT_226886 [Emiliania huxleyi CCMP1516]
MERPLPVSSTIHLVGKFVLLFCGLHVASILVAPRLFATHYRPLSPSEQRDWHGRVVGSLFATGIVFVALPEYLWPGDALAADEAFGTSDRASLACAIAAAFFVWDVFFCTAACQGWPFVLHASAGLFIYWHALQPFQQRAACFFLCWEASTPLLNLRSQLIACRLTHTRTFSCANVGFAAAFLIIRWGFGMPGSVFWWSDSIALLRAGDPRLRPHVVFVTMAANLALNSLNVWWGSKVLAGVARLARGRGESGASGGEAPGSPSLDEERALELLRPTDAVEPEDGGQRNSHSRFFVYICLHEDWHTILDHRTPFWIIFETSTAALNERLKGGPRPLR